MRGRPLVTSVFPSERASNAENISISWNHHDCKIITSCLKWAICMSLCIDYPSICCVWLVVQHHTYLFHRMFREVLWVSNHIFCRIIFLFLKEWSSQMKWCKVMHNVLSLHLVPSVFFDTVSSYSLGMIGSVRVTILPLQVHPCSLLVITFVTYMCATLAQKVKVNSLPSLQQTYGRIDFQDFKMAYMYTPYR